MAAQVHYPSVSSFDDVELAAICDSHEGRLNEVGERFDIKERYVDYEKMLANVRPDAVYVIGPPHHMYDIWVNCLKKGLHLFIEKPMGLTLHQARCLADLATKHSCITQVGFQRRSAPIATKLLEECRRFGGDVVHAVCRFYKFDVRPFYSGSGHMMDDGVHAIDTLRWLCGGEVLRVQSVTRRVGTPDHNFFSALLEFDTGATGILINSWTSGRRIFDVEIHAKGVCAEFEHEDKGWLYAAGDAQGREFDTREVSGSQELYVYGGFQAKSREFIEAIQTNALPASHFGDALKTMEVAAAILAQAELPARAIV